MEVVHIISSVLWYKCKSNIFLENSGTCIGSWLGVEIWECELKVNADEGEPAESVFKQTKWLTDKLRVMHTSPG